MKRKLSSSKDAENEFLLNTAGSKARITVHMKKEKKIIFSDQSLDDFQAITASSTNCMKKLVNFIRSSAGRNSVPTNYNQHMYEKSNMVENIYTEGLYAFQADKEAIENRPVVYANATELLDILFEKPIIEHIEKTKIKQMADGGQDFFKFLSQFQLKEMTKNKKMIQMYTKVRTFHITALLEVFQQMNANCPVSINCFYCA